MELDGADRHGDAVTVFAEAEAGSSQTSDTPGAAGPGGARPNCKMEKILLSPPCLLSRLIHPPRNNVTMAARALASAALLALSSAQEQLHLSVTGRANEMALDFIVHPATATGISVKLGSVSVPTDCETATINGYTAQFCVALFTGLASNTAYSYIVSSSVNTSATYSFTNAPSSRPPIFAVYADFGIGNDESMSTLVADGKNGGFDYVLHAGDCA